ncbi:hypothetical protein BKA66DRAFT_565479 [Pyrenochaeta sp. MPI-SDFR-AT-0127]|nr:hypothetical protein BKA66DRAFT_565479 [Pyrenochaeta sp. MPI-SDFR-AT-0127]
MAPSRNILSPSRQHSEESWVEIESRPSSSSLSSAAEEIITTGLTVQHDSNLHRRNRRARGGGQFQIGTGHRITSTGGNSSQEEYEESESESDRVMTSSNEGIRPSPLRHELQRSSRSPHSVASSETMSEREEDDEDDDENATAVNYPRSSRREFQPRPNAFSHPNSQQAIRSQSGTAYTPRRNVRPTTQRQQSYPQHTPYNAIAPAYQPDHDEALRASLSTLLSAAAAVRGLPKPGQPRMNAPASARIDPTSLRLVPESVALGDVPEETVSSPRTASSSPSDKAKRKASPPAAATRSSSKDRRAVKKARQSGPVIEDISPTLLTWVVSAGVVVLVSALSFSAGYVVGKEAGHAEALGQVGAAGTEAGRCGKEAAAGLKGTGLGLRKQIWSGSAGIRA